MECPHRLRQAQYDAQLRSRGSATRFGARRPRGVIGRSFEIPQVSRAPRHEVIRCRPWRAAHSVFVAEKDQIVYPKGDATKGRILGRTVNGKPEDGTLQVKAPFHLAVDQQDRIWVTNSGSDTVGASRQAIPAKPSRPRSASPPRAIAIDSLGNAWINNTVGHPDTREVGVG
jgi:streptogramin lyase